MYNIQLFKNIFAEAEIMCMNESFLKALNKLIDERMGLRIKQFFREFKEEGIEDHPNAVARALTTQYNMIHDILGDKVTKYTFHTEIESRNLMDFFNQLAVETALLTIEDRKQAMINITWLLQNKLNCVSRIPSRERKDFLEFEKEVKQLEMRVSSLLINFEQIGIQLNTNPNLERRILKANKEFFFSNHEEEKFTRMTRIINNFDTLEVVLHGLNYQELCAEKDLPRHMRRSFQVFS